MFMDYQSFDGYSPLYMKIIQCLVLGSAIGPAVATLLVGPLGYRGLFLALAGIGAIATLVVVFFVPETLEDRGEVRRGRAVEALANTSDLSTVL